MAASVVQLLHVLAGDDDADFEGSKAAAARLSMAARAAANEPSPRTASLLAAVGTPSAPNCMSREPSACCCRVLPGGRQRIPSAENFTPTRRSTA